MTPEVKALDFMWKVLLGYFVLIEWFYPNWVLNSWFNKGICYILAFLSTLFLNLCGFEADLAKTLISIHHTPTLYVATPCSGLNFIFLLGIVTFSYPTNSTSQLLFLTKGILLIIVLNIVRIVSLAVIHRYWISLFEINHHLIFNMLVYGAVFWFWVSWVRRLETNTINVA